MSVAPDAASTISMAEIARMDLRTSRSGDTATASLQRALRLQYRYQPARLAIARSLGIPTDPARPENLDGRVIRGETLLGSAPEEIGLWTALLSRRNAAVLDSRRVFQEMVAAHWARGAGLLWDDLRDAADAPAALAEQLLKPRR